MTDQISLFPAQNWALLEESDATSLPGIHAVDLFSQSSFNWVWLLSFRGKAGRPEIRDAEIDLPSID